MTIFHDLCSWIPPRAYWLKPFLLMRWLRQRRYRHVMAKWEVGVREWARRQHIAEERRQLPPLARYAQSIKVAQRINVVGDGQPFSGQPKPKRKKSAPLTSSATH